MADAYIQRSLEPVLEKAAREFPAVVVVGPRQSGKTTLLRHLYGARIPLVSLEPPDARAAATHDPRGFLALNPPPVIFDEIQYAPDLLPYIKEQIDAERNRAGQFIRTGSQNLLLMQKVTESLAGRAAILKLLPMSRREIQHTPHRPLAWETAFQCRIALSPEVWVKAYEAHGQGDIWMDLGCGKGEFLAGLAEIYPKVFFIGIEVRKRVAEKYFPKYEHLTNLVLLHGNVNLSIPSMMDGHKVQRVFIHFPDPYSRKDRYKKRRMVNEAFIQGLCEILTAGGTVSVKTDDQFLFEDMDVLLSSRLDPAPASKDLSAEATVLTEWEQECMRKSMPIYSREYRLR